MPYEQGLISPENVQNQEHTQAFSEHANINESAYVAHNTFKHDSISFVNNSDKVVNSILLFLILVLFIGIVFLLSILFFVFLFSLSSRIMSFVILFIVLMLFVIYFAYFLGRNKRFKNQKYKRWNVEEK